MKQIIAIISITLFCFTGIGFCADKVVVIPLNGIGGNIQDTSSGDADSGDILIGKKAWVDGLELTGALELSTTMQTYSTPTYGMTFNLIPAGTFTMGSPDGSGEDPVEPGGT